MSRNKQTDTTRASEAEPSAETAPPAAAGDGGRPSPSSEETAAREMKERAEKERAEKERAEKERAERERRDLKALVERHRKHFSRATQFWYLIYVLGLYLPVIFAVAAVLMLSLDSLASLPYRIDYAVILIVAAAVLSVLSASVGYSRNWRMSRISLSGVEKLEVAMTKGTPDLDDIRQKLNEIIDMHGQGKLGLD